MKQAPSPRTTHPADRPRASGGVYRRRLEVCAACQYRRGSRCLKSEMLLTLRARRKESACPLDRWAAVETLPRAFRPNSGADIRIIDPNAWITTRQLIDDTAWMNGYLPGDIDAVIGIARSGLIPAQQIACMRHLPLLACRIGWSHAEEAVVDVGNGWRLCDHDRQPFRKVLLVDDTAWHGRSMSWATAVVRRSFPQAQIVRAAVFATSHSQEFLDAWAGTYDGLHYLEWNLFNSGHAETLATDFDGILCPDFSTEEDDDGPRYVEALRGRPALQTPRRVAVGAIITARLEKYRRETEAWLADYGIRYQRLVMGPWATQTERQRADVAAWKARQFLSAGLELFVESDPAQAAAIHWRTGKKVLCPALGKVLEGTANRQPVIWVQAGDRSVSDLSSTGRRSVSRLTVVTCHFNPCGYTRPRENYDCFAEGVAAAGVELFTVELAYDDDPFDLPAAQLRIRGRRDRHLLWQKERLLNLLIAKLPAETEAIAWIDADILFEDATGWAGAALEGLKQWPVLQPWSHCHYLDASGQIGMTRMSVGWYYHHQPHLHANFEISHPGFAWAGRADWLRRYGLYDAMITGGGDSLMIAGFTGGVIPWANVVQDQWRAHATAWNQSLAGELAGRLGYIAGTIRHRYHGSTGNRRYFDRWLYLSQYHFDPARDIQIDESTGLWAWTEHAYREKAAMIDLVSHYFVERREDE